MTVADDRLLAFTCEQQHTISGLGSAEAHVKDFSIWHQCMLGLGQEDVET
jgi:hypothetical protein